MTKIEKEVFFKLKSSWFFIREIKALYVFLFYYFANIKGAVSISFNSIKDRFILYFYTYLYTYIFMYANLMDSKILIFMWNYTIKKTKNERLNKYSHPNFSRVLYSSV